MHKKQKFGWFYLIFGERKYGKSGAADTALL